MSDVSYWMSIFVASIGFFAVGALVAISVKAKLIMIAGKNTMTLPSWVAVTGSLGAAVATAFLAERAFRDPSWVNVAGLTVTAVLLLIPCWEVLRRGR